MKRLFTTSILAMGLALGAAAQEAETITNPSRFGFGVRMGFGTAFIDGDKPFDDTEKIFNMHVGAAVTYDLAPNFDLETGLYYTKKGYYYESGRNEVTCNLYYLQLPLMAGYKMKASNSLEFALKAGPYVAYGINGKTKVKTSVETIDALGKKIKEEKTDEYDTLDEFKRFDIGAKVALNCTIKKSFMVGATYEHGFANVYDGDADAFNKTVALTIGFNF